MKKLLALVLALLLTLSLAACGGKTEAPAKTEASPKNEEPAKTEDPAKTEETAPAEASAPVGQAWPDNEFTQKVPALPFTIESFPDNGANMFGVNFSNAAMEDGKAYGDALQAAGFSEDVRGTLEPGEKEPYTLTASNADGWGVEYECGVYGFGSLYITKP